MKRGPVPVGVEVAGITLVILVAVGIFTWFLVESERRECQALLVAAHDMADTTLVIRARRGCISTAWEGR